MLGLQTSYDIKNVARLTAAASEGSNSRSHTFTKNFIGKGFDVAGVSNSLKKHGREMNKDANTEPKVANKQSQLAQEEFIRRQDEETERDQQRLEELELKIKDIQHKKQLRKERDMNRRKRRMEYIAAGKIQKCFREFARHKLVIASKVIIHFIKIVKNRNALTVGSWASTVIARFAKFATGTFKEGREANEKAEKMKALWEMAAKQMKEDNETRKTIAHSVTVNSLRHGLVTVAKKKITELREISRRKKKDQKWRGKGSAAAKKSPPKSQSSPKACDTKEKIFLTDTNCDETSTYSSDNSCSPLSTANNTTTEIVDGMRKNFVDSANIPAMLPQNVGAGFSTDFDGDIGLDLLDFEEDPYDEEAELEKERLEELQRLHELREMEQQRERLARLAAIEKKKELKNEEDAKKIREETEAREARDNARYDWLDKQEDKRMERATMLTKKRKAQEREQKREKKELEFMRAEDKEKKKSIAMPKIKIKRPRTPTEFEVELERLKEQEEIDQKEAATKKMFEQNKEATKKRLEARAEKDKKQKEVEIEKENAKKEMQKKIADDAQEALARAMEAKKISDQAEKQRKKEMNAMDADDKIPKGRTHNSKGKKILKGFANDHDKTGKDNNKSSSKINKNKIISISSNITVRDPSVEEWNYNCQPSDDVNKTQASSNDSDFKFDEFLVNAKEHSLSVNELTEDFWPFGEESNDDEKEVHLIKGENVVGANIALPEHDNNNTDNSSKDINGERSQFMSDDKENADIVDILQKTTSRPVLAKKNKVKKKGLQDQDQDQDNSNSKLSIAEIAGSHIRDVRIPKALKDTPYFKSYVNVKNIQKSASNIQEKKQEDIKKMGAPPPIDDTFTQKNIDATIAVLDHLTSPLTMAPPPSLGGVKHSQPKLSKKNKGKGSLAKPGKVATLLEMVARARNKVNASAAPSEIKSNTDHKKKSTKHKVSKVVPNSEIRPTLDTESTIIQMAPSPYFPPPPKLELDDIKIEEGDENENMSGSLCDYYFASKDSMEDQYFEKSETEHFPSGDDSDGKDDAKSLKIDAINLEENDEIIAEEDRQEAALSAECDELRIRLESRLALSSAGTGNGDNTELNTDIQSIPQIMPPSMNNNNNERIKSADISVPVIAQKPSGYQIDLDLPEFSLNLLSAWAKEDGEDEDEHEDKL